MSQTKQTNRDIWDVISKTPQSDESILFDTIRRLLYRDHLGIDAIIETLGEFGVSKKDVLRAHAIISRQYTEADRLEELKLMTERPLIVTPGLDSVVFDFGSHFFVSGEGPVMILGPTGVGKTLFLYVAKKLFRKRHEDEENVPPIIEANCGHFAGKHSDLNISRSELFGHVKGAFTGALNDKQGLVEKANGGLLILEEIGELPFEVQAMLLTFIETGEYRRLGEDNVRKAKAKIVGATNHESDLREDFKYRFFPYYIPALRDRKGDILYYFYEFFPQLTKGFSRSDVLILLSHHWPGNVREIQRIGMLLMRTQWFEKQMAESEYDFGGAYQYPLISYLDPKDISFDPDLLRKLHRELCCFDVDLSLLEKLLNTHRVLTSDVNSGHE
jgi:hypothetical protein